MSTTVRALLVTLALYAALFGLALVRYGPPPPASVSAPESEFSAVRARAVLGGIVGDGATRYVGTPGNARAREVIVAELTKYGFSVDTQQAMSCSFHGFCAPVVNVVGRLLGREPNLPGVLMTAHYDSVAVSPGAGDDGVGIAAVLETARALGAGQRPRRTVVAVLTDGEEAGLLGAEAFVRGSPLADKVKMTVNVDARGVRGPSMMFETTPGNRWLVALLASHLARPVTSSVFYEVYRRMPNDTDFTATKRIAAGVNFANTVGIEDYHTSRDSLDHLSLGTLQHHGDNVLAMMRAFTEVDAGVRSDAKSDEDAVCFDVFALGIVFWPVSWSLPIAVAGLALVMAQALRSRTELGQGLVAFCVVVLGLLAAGGVAWALRAAGAFPVFFLPHPEYALGAIHAAAGLGVLAPGAILARRASPRALWAGVWGGWGAVGVATAIYAPGASYLFTVPTLAAGVFSALSFEIGCAAPAVVAGAVVLGLAANVYPTLGFSFLPLVGASTALLAVPLLPMLPGLSRAAVRGGAIGLGAAIAVGGVGAVLAPKFDRSSPQRVNAVFSQNEEHARSFVDSTWGFVRWGDPPKAMVHALGPVEEERAAFPWTQLAPCVEDARLDEPPPTLELLSRHDRRYRVRVRSPRQAPALALVVPAAFQVTWEVEGHAATPRVIGNWAVLGLLAMPKDGVVVDLEPHGAPPEHTGQLPVTLYDRSPGVPPGSKADAALRARGTLDGKAVESQDGDVTVLRADVFL